MDETLSTNPEHGHGATGEASRRRFLATSAKLLGGGVAALALAATR